MLKYSLIYNEKQQRTEPVTVKAVIGVRYDKAKSLLFTIGFTIDTVFHKKGAAENDLR